jgi:hypothetical protein
MQTGVISFCDRINYNIKSTDTKDEILKELGKKYNIQVLQRHWYHLDDKGYDHLTRLPHLVCLRSNGNPYYLCFMRYEDVPIIYFIDKKVQPGYQQPRILLGRGRWDDRMYDNTVFDGEMVKDKYGSWVFLINDVIAYQGQQMYAKALPERLELAIDALAKMQTPDPITDCCTFHVKRYAEASKEGVDALIDMSRELPYTSRGLYFWPHSLKYKPKLVNFDDNLIKSVVRKVKDVPDFRCSTDPEPTPMPVLLPVPEVAITKTHVLTTESLTWMRKTDLPDVYDVYAEKDSGGRGEKIGVALIPNLKVSKMMRSIFKETTVAVYIKMISEYDKKHDKWLPIAEQKN